jgi:predicted patatin/cPLA2 family phospholipase
MKNKGNERNKKALADFQRYFDRIADSLQDRVSEYMQMKKYIRVFEESNKLLSIDIDLT